jgi:superfamily I DNA/RNA helicase
MGKVLTLVGDPDQNLYEFRGSIKDLFSVRLKRELTG